MKVIKKFLQWAAAIFFMLIGALLFTDCAISGILFLAGGIIMIPKVYGKIPEFPKKNAVMAGVVAVCVIVGIGVFPTSEEDEGSVSGLAAADTEKKKIEQDAEQTAGQVKREEKDSVKDEPESEKEMAKQEPEPAKGMEKEELKQWVLENIEKDISDSKIEKLKEDTNEADFFGVWKECLNDDVKEIKTVNEYQISVISEYCDFYCEIWGNSDEIKTITSKYSQIKSDISGKAKLQARYGIDLEAGKQVYTNAFYVAQRLESSYEDNLLGKLQKTIDTYSSDNTSDWVSYNVEYYFDTPSAGDDCYILHSDIPNPFSSSGAYNITYVEMDETVDLVDSRGFQMTVPVFYIVDGSEYQSDQAEWNRLDKDQEDLSRELSFLLK